MIFNSMAAKISVIVGMTGSAAGSNCDGMTCSCTVVVGSDSQGTVCGHIGMAFSAAAVHYCGNRSAVTTGTFGYAV